MQYKDELGIIRYYGIYSGVVEDADDPEKIYRVKVKVPDIFGDDYLDYWAEPFGVPMGKDYGLINPLKKGDRVRIQFENGDPNYPLWTYGSALKDDTIKRIKDDYGKVAAFKSRDGNEIILDDKKNKVEITQQNGTSIHLENNKIKLGKNASHPILKGDLTVETLKNIQVISKAVNQLYYL